MSILNRIKKIEQKTLTQSIEEKEPEICKHPPSMFKLRRDYPASGYVDHRLVVKGHCNVCGFDDYLWAFYDLTEEQEARRQELFNSSAFWEGQAYDLQLINAGLISYTLYPPSPEVQIKFTGKVSIRTF